MKTTDANLQQADCPICCAQKFQRKELQVINVPQGKGYVPGIRLAGEWLQNLGFNRFDRVVITCAEGMINIQKI
jgi:hypothetical protein